VHLETVLYFMMYVHPNLPGKWYI